MKQRVDKDDDKSNYFVNHDFDFIVEVFADHVLTYCDDYLALYDKHPTLCDKCPTL